jgi:ubiquinone/menaquinone biosynthesis C-methylase UbiE
MTEHVSTRRSYDAVATQYAAAIGDELRHKPLHRALLNLISDLAADGVVLDLGCGPGHVAAHLAEHCRSPRRRRDHDGRVVGQCG